MKPRFLATSLALCFLIAANFARSQTNLSEAAAREIRLHNLSGIRATYNLPPRLENGRMDAPRLIRQLEDIHANTYSFGIHGSTNDWEDFQLLLPLARAHGIRIWGSVVPPSESPPRAKSYAEPFKLDYERWAMEFAKLSLRETNLVAWSIDDFTYNEKVFTAEHLKKMMDEAHAINPKLAFVPCCYYKSFTPEFARTYTPLVDGFLFPYRHESGGADLTNADLVAPEVKTFKELTGGAVPIIVDIYATAHSRLGKSTPEYVEQVMVAAGASADGVMIYCHQDPDRYPEKYQIVKRLFTQWSASSVQAGK